MEMNTLPYNPAFHFFPLPMRFRTVFFSLAELSVWYSRPRHHRHRHRHHYRLLALLPLHYYASRCWVDSTLIEDGLMPAHPIRCADEKKSPFAFMRTNVV